MNDFREITWKSPEGLRLFAREWGDAAAPRLPVVCIPGLTRSSRDFEEVAPLIAATGRRVIAVDLRGRGLSEWDSEPARYKPATYAADVVALLDQLALPRAHFVGTSLGGIVTMTLASRHLGRIAGAVLNDVGPVVASEGLKRIATYAGRPQVVQSWADAVAYARRTNGVAFPDNTDADWELFAKRLFREDANGIPVLACDSRVFRPLPSFLVWLLSPLSWFLFRKLANGTPTLLVRGALSDILDAPTVARMRAQAPSMEYVEVDRVGHAPMLTEPAARAAFERRFTTAP